MADIIRFNDPFAGLTTLHSQLDDMFNNFFTNMPVPTHGTPAMDVYTEDDKQLVAEVQIPGFNKDDVEVSVHQGLLEIKGEKHEKTEDTQDKKRNYMVRESHASFYRSIALPKQADEAGVKAKFNNGLLKVTVPFTEFPKPKKVAIEGGK